MVLKSNVVGLQLRPQIILALFVLVMIVYLTNLLMEFYCLKNIEVLILISTCKLSSDFIHTLYQFFLTNVVYVLSLFQAFPLRHSLEHLPISYSIIRD